jgi:four helix bundle protein
MKEANEEYRTGNKKRKMGDSMKGDDILERLLDLAVRLGKVVDALPDTKMGRHVGGQLVRCGTAGPPNYNEGRAAESRDDFIHKLAIVLKELRETEVWLKFIAKADLLPGNRLGELLDENDQLERIIAKSIITAKTNRTSKRRNLALLSFAFFVACSVFLIL